MGLASPRHTARGLAGVLTVAVGAALAVLLGPGGAMADDPPRELARARAQLGAISAELDRASARASDAELDLEIAERTLAEIEQVINEVALEVEAQRVAVGDLELQLEQVAAETAELEERFRGRIARLYKQGPTAALDLLLAGGPARDAAARGTYLELATRGDPVSIEQLEAGQVRLQAAQQRVAEEQARLQRLLEEQHELREEAEALRDRRELALADQRREVRELRAARSDLEAEEERLTALIRRQQEEARRAAAPPSRATPPASGSTAGGGGGATGFVWPLCAPVTSEYGPRWGRIHRGIDQGAPPGTPVGASAAGRVTFAGWQGGYGRLVLIDHGGGIVTAYAHLRGFAVGRGATVNQRQVIGYVGSSGNSTGPHLHTEFRVNGTAVNPRQFLRGSPC